eukprot:104102-Prorocentrum_minimum.AAC.1
MFAAGKGEQHKEYFMDNKLSGAARGGNKVYFMDNKLSGAARGVYRKVFAKMEALAAVAVAGRNTAPTGMEGIMFALSLCQKVRRGRRGSGEGLNALLMPNILGINIAVLQRKLAAWFMQLTPARKHNPVALAYTTIPMACYQALFDEGFAFVPEALRFWAHRLT